MICYSIIRFPLDVEITNLDRDGNTISVERPGDDLNTPNTTPQYFSTTEFSELSGLAVQTIYNYRKKGIFIEGVHFYRPNNGKLLFDRAAVISWLEQGRSNCTSKPKQDICANQAPEQKAQPATPQKNLINI